MDPKLLDLTPAQLKVYRTIQAERRAWVALWAILTLASVGFAAFLVAAFYRQTAATLISGGIEGIFGWQLKQVYRHIYPDPPASG